MRAWLYRNGRNTAGKGEVRGADWERGGTISPIFGCGRMIVQTSGNLPAIGTAVRLGEILMPPSTISNFRPG
jgi:hypothetical protein